MATSHRHLENHKKIADITIHLNALKHVYDNKKMQRYNIKKKLAKKYTAHFLRIQIVKKTDSLTYYFYFRFRLPIVAMKNQGRSRANF